MASFELGTRYPKARTTLDYGQFIVPVSTFIIDETYDHTSMVYPLMITLSVFEIFFLAFHWIYKFSVHGYASEHLEFFGIKIS